MKKIHSLILVGASMLIASCATTLKNAPTSNIDISDNESNPITKLTVTFDFNGGTYNGSTEQVEFNDVKPTSYWKYVKAHLTGTITPPDHTTFKGFSFAQDDSDIIPDSYVVKENITVYAQYEPSDPHCVVEWLDEEGSTPLAIENYFLGDTPEFKGTLPYHEGKSFGGWDPEIHAITQEEIKKGSISYTAIYVSITTVHIVTLDYDDDSEQPIHTQKVFHEECAVKPEITKEGYKLDKWEYTGQKSGDFDFETLITEDIEIKAIWVKATYTITWLNYDGTVIKTEEVKEGGTPTKPNNPRRSSPFIEYTFLDWSPAVSEKVHSDQIYVATYRAEHIYRDTEAYMYVNIAEDNKDFAFTCTATSNITIDWGDGTPQESMPAGTISHAYNTTGEYSIRIFNPITTIDGIATNDKTLIEEVYFGKETSSIGESTFKDCSNLKIIVFENESKLTSIGKYAFGNCSSLTSINISSGVTSIGQSAFNGCSKLKSVTFAENSSLAEISSSVFQSCSSLVSITIPSSVTLIRWDAFQLCSNLKTIIFEEGSKLQTINDRAFQSCSSLTSINIPSGVTEIGGWAFRGCSNLQTVDLTALDAVPTLGDYAFEDCPDSLKLYVKTDLVETFKAAPGWSNYATKIVPGPVPSMN